MRTTYDRVWEFHEAFGQGHRNSQVPRRPSDVDPKEIELQLKLIDEELKELKDALAADDLVECADALADLDYVVNGLNCLLGLPMEPLAIEVHRSNMTKLCPDGTPILRPDGKILKSGLYEPPRIKELITQFTTGEY